MYQLSDWLALVGLVVNRNILPNKWTVKYQYPDTFQELRQGSLLPPTAGSRRKEGPSFLWDERAYEQHRSFSVYLSFCPFLVSFYIVLYCCPFLLSFPAVLLRCPFLLSFYSVFSCCLSLLSFFPVTHYLAAAWFKRMFREMGREDVTVAKLCGTNSNKETVMEGFGSGRSVDKPSRHF